MLTMAEGVNTPRSAEQSSNGENGQLPNGDGENMEVEDHQHQIQNEGGAVGVAEVEQEQAESEREITQTDHINKSLLTSFLSRLNDPATASQFPANQSLDSEFDDEED